MSKKHGEWIDSLSGKNSDLEKRYGVGAVKLSRPGSETWEEDTKSRENYRKDMQEGARNDYDTRRTLEAAAMSGKKKAQKIIDSGFKDISDIRNAQNFMEKAAVRHGQGGDFSSASDYMGLTQSMVERDRRKQEENLVSKDFLDQKLKDLQKTKRPDGTSNEEIEYTDSDEFAAAKERLESGVYDTSTSMFKNNAPAEEPVTAFRKANSSAPASDDRAKATSSYLEQYKQDMIKGGRIEEARSSNLANAMNTVISSNI